MLKRFAFTLIVAVFVTGLASARYLSSHPITQSDTTIYYLDGKLVSAGYFQTLDANTLAFIDVDKGAGTVRGFTKDAAPTDPRSYQTKGAKIDWSVAQKLRDVTFIVDDQVTNSPVALSLTSEQIESVYQLPPSATGPNGEVGSFGKNGVVLITTKKR